MSEKECTLALNFGGGAENEENVPARIYEQPLLQQPDPSTLILEAHIHANPVPKVGVGALNIENNKVKNHRLLGCAMVTLSRRVTENLPTCYPWKVKRINGWLS